MDQKQTQMHGSLLYPMRRYVVVLILTETAQCAHQRALPLSLSQNLAHRHTIEANGYNSGRDDLVAAAMRGGTFGNRLWKADVEWVEGLLPVGADGINHGIEIDGMVAVLTVQRHYTVSEASYKSSPQESPWYTQPLPLRIFSQLRRRCTALLVRLLNL